MNDEHGRRPRDVRARAALHLQVEPKIGTDSTVIIPSGVPALWILVAAYIPLLAWAPLLGALTVAYHRRRARAAAGPRPRPVHVPS